VGDGRGKIPVFRVTVTEAHCFAEWLGGLHGRLPTDNQWCKACGRYDDHRKLTPFDGNRAGIAVGLGKEGPWPVDKGDRDVSFYGCRQMAGNGNEWTRTVQDPIDKDNAEIPLRQMLTVRRVFYRGQDYAASNSLTFESMDDPASKPCTENSFAISFRVVLEP
jgi:formylglycine-generating enzyme required for sulfatase activity